MCRDAIAQIGLAVPGWNLRLIKGLVYDSLGPHVKSRQKVSVPNIELRNI